MKIAHWVRGSSIACCEALFDSCDDRLVTTETRDGGARRSGSEADEEDEH